ncbi:hypothetical protein N7474_000769 [Penicillium riverlandense]|uniref:uncharacterized protein n=1 Tax=Penicillium riverlandense TaxID=1903569 RepID=UPI0025470D10|nr:uncharacterized protein N7474_000769 [Penicillium riverlandense]KAJ5832458.1 hypothetical protein N7474_000769 [Penicillium riverlandense]
MNARAEGSDIFSTSPIHYASRNSHYDTAVTILQNNQVLAYTLAAILAAYLVLDHFGFAPISVIHAAWNSLVVITPARLVVALDPGMAKSDHDDGDGASNAAQMTFQTKSEAMQRIFGLDNTSSFPFFPRPRSLSGLGTALLGNNKDAFPPGLGNWDNSCYQNSIIQGLASLRSLSAFLGRNVDTLAETGSLSTHQALRGIIDRLNSASNDGRKLWIPPDLKSMSSWQQQDAQEYFSKVVDQIDIEIRKASKGQTKNMGLKIAGREENVVRDTSLDLEAVDEEDALPTPTIEKSSFRNPLEGLLAQRVGCMKCGWTEGLSLIPFNCLTVPLGGKFEYDVRECLGQYMVLEPIEGVECAKCTLLRSQEQLRSLLGGIEEDQNASLSSDSVQLNDAVKKSAEERLAAVNEALEENDFAEKTLANKCRIPSKSRVSTTKSRQAVIARTPKCLVIHMNRSLFDEMTGMLKKNYAAVKFPKTLDLSDWCLGAQVSEQESLEQWDMNPAESMLPQPGEAVQITTSPQYELRAIITHYGRHENGHYICYRKYPTAVFPAQPPDEVLQVEGDKEKAEHWYRLSDEDVQMVSEAHVMSQGGAFMLFYEAIDESPLAHSNHVQSKTAESVSNSTMSENLSAASTVTDADSSTSRATTVTDADSSTSRATSVSTPERAALPAEDVKATVPPLKTSNAVDSAVHAPAEEAGTQSVATAS